MGSSSIAAPFTIGREEDATPDPSLSPSSPAPPPAPAPPLLPSASTKRRWSPCTWRYAIEESQADLPSRSRSTTTTIAAANAGSGAHPSNSSRLPSHHPQQQHPHPIKAKPPPLHQTPSFSKSAESAPQRNSSHHRGYPLPTESHMRPSAHTSLKSRTTELSNKKSLQHEFLSARVSEKEEEEKEDDRDQDDTSEDGDDADGRAVCFDDEYFKRRRREMSPSELYFCADCAAAKGRTKLINDQS